MILDSAAAIARARAAIGRPDGSGACLANVYAWYGSVQSIGPGAGKFGRAIDAWDYAEFKHGDIMEAPAGVPVYFGQVTEPRWPGDRNMGAGDIGLSLGGGYGIFTDSPTGTPGIMSFRARSSQIKRPAMLGWASDFLGHDTTAGLAWDQRATPIVVQLKPPTYWKTEDTMALVSVNDPRKPHHNDIVAFEGLSVARHTTAANVISIGRSEGILRPEDDNDPKVRARLRDLGFEVTSGQLRDRLQLMVDSGATRIDPYFKDLVKL